MFRWSPPRGLRTISALGLFLFVTFFPSLTSAQSPEADANEQPATSSRSGPSEVPLFLERLSTSTPTSGGDSRARIANLSANLNTRLEQTVTRLVQISGRLESRMTIMREGNLDVSGAESYYDEAQTLLTRASQRLSVAEADMISALSGPQPEAAWPKIRSDYEASYTDIVNAHKNLIISLGVLIQVSLPVPSQIQ